MTERTYSAADVANHETVMFWLGGVLAAVIFGVFGFIAGFEVCDGLHECHTEDTRACVFGPGIVGTQACGYSDRWKPCEPDPRYRVDGKKP